MIESKSGKPVKRTRPRPPRGGAAMFHGLIGEWIAAVAPYTEAAPEAITAGMLVAAGNAIGRAPWVSVGPSEHRSNLLVLLIGATSIGRKGDSMRAAILPVRRARPDWHERSVHSGLASGEALVHATRDPSEGDPGGVGELLVVEAEFGSLLRVAARPGNIASPILRSAFDGEALEVLAKNVGERASKPHVSLIGAITPSELLDLGGGTEAANGLLNRHMLIYTERVREIADPGPVPEREIAEIALTLRDRIEKARSRGGLERTPDARDLWVRIYPALSRLPDSLHGALLARGPAIVTRASLIYALLDGSDAIDVAHLKAALALWDVCRESVEIIFGGLTGNRDADSILSELMPGDSMRRNDLREHVLGRHATAARLQRALDLLVDAGEIVLEDGPINGGRPPEIVRRLKPEERERALEARFAETGATA